MDQSGETLGLTSALPPTAARKQTFSDRRFVPTTDIFDSAALRRFGHVNYFTKNHSFHVGKEAVALRQLQ
jgi:hypothetical protein